MFKMDLKNNKYGLILFDDDIKFYIGGETKKEIKNKLLDWYGEVCLDEEFVYKYCKEDDSEHIEDFKPKIYNMHLEKLIKYICDIMSMEYMTSHEQLSKIGL